ncbi:Thioredoxin-like 4A [Paraconiothyrium brasiliense]|uniref:Spliceosomal protein DIB1 n=1 Tax=Paraconiothyrium brasiliense TaxID=300254 RepID=A0ABR3QM36_9PLEO
MGSIVLPHLHSGWHVDQAILSEDRRVVVLRFGKAGSPPVMQMDEHLYKIADKIKKFASVYIVDNTEVPDFNAMYEIYDELDFGTGNNNKINFAISSKEELIDIIETVYRGASKGKGLVVSPKDYSTKWLY